MLSIFCYSGFILTKILIIGEYLEKYSRYLTDVIYFFLGLYILWESGTILHVWNLILI